MLKSKLKEIINNCFFHKNGNRRYKYIVLGYLGTYVVKDHSDVHAKYSEAHIFKMLEFLIDNIFVEFSEQICGQTWGWSGGAKVLGILPVPGRPTIRMIVGQGSIALAVGAGGGCLDIFTLCYLFSPLSPLL